MPMTPAELRALSDSEATELLRRLERCERARAEIGAGVAFFTPKEAAAYLRCTLRRLTEHVGRGLPFVRLGTARTKHFRQEDIDAWVESRVFQESGSPEPEPSATSAATRQALILKDPRAAAILQELRRHRLTPPRPLAPVKPRIIR